MEEDAKDLDAEFRRELMSIPKSTIKAYAIIVVTEQEKVQGAHRLANWCGGIWVDAMLANMSRLTHKIMMQDFIPLED